MASSRARRPETKEREFSPEAELLVRWRIQRYKRRTGKTSNDSVVTELNEWPGITRWYPKAFATTSKPIFSRRMLDTWITGDTSHGGRRHTTPGAPRLAIIADFLIEKRYLFGFELVSDESGFALTAALHAFHRDKTDIETAYIEGDYEAFTNDAESIVFHKVSIYREPTDDIFLVESQTVKSYSRSSNIKERLRSVLTEESAFALRTRHKGWGLCSKAEQLIAFLRSGGDWPSPPKPWLWQFEIALDARYLHLISGNSGSEAASYKFDLERSHDFPVMKSLTSPNDTGYHLGREAGFDLAIIRRIMERQNRVELTQLDREFLRAVYRLDPVLTTEALNSGANINTVDPETGLTALLFSAAGGVGGMVYLLAQQPDLNPTIRDPKGRLPSDMLPLIEVLTPVYERLIDLEASYAERHPPGP